MINRQTDTQTHRHRHTTTTTTTTTTTQKLSNYSVFDTETDHSQTARRTAIAHTTAYMYNTTVTVSNSPNHEHKVLGVLMLVS